MMKLFGYRSDIASSTASASGRKLQGVKRKRIWEKRKKKKIICVYIGIKTREVKKKKKKSIWEVRKDACYAKGWGISSYGQPCCHVIKIINSHPISPQGYFDLSHLFSCHKSSLLFSRLRFQPTVTLFLSSICNVVSYIYFFFSSSLFYLISILFPLLQMRWKTKIKKKYGNRDECLEVWGIRFSLTLQLYVHFFSLLSRIKKS